MLGRLKTRRRAYGARWGWVTLSGPPGAGVSRVLDAFDEHVRADGGPALLRIRPEPEARVPLAALRHVLRGFFPQASGRPLERTLRGVLPGDGDGIRVLAAWIGAPTCPGRAPTVDPHLVRRLLERLVPVGPLLVDDLDHLDPASLDVLRPSAEHQGFGILAGACGPACLIQGAEVWGLEPLGTQQIELLLRRWLRQPATARRLTAALTERCGGWPGRVVEAVRQLARRGHLERRQGRVFVVRAPKVWPDGLRSSGTLRAWLATQTNAAARIIDLAAVAGTPDDLPLLADAAGVKPCVAYAVAAEVVASRGGAAQDRFFATEAARRSWRDGLSSSDRAAAGCRLEDARAHREGAGRARAVLAQRPRAPLPASDALERSARWHADLAVTATARQHPRAASTHHRRALHLHLAHGDLPEAAAQMLALARSEIERGRLAAARPLLARAERVFGLLGDAPRTVEAGHLAGRIRWPLDDSLGAARHLLAALAAARLDLAAGRVEEACEQFEVLCADPQLPLDLRARCTTHLAEALRRADRPGEARVAAVAAAALLAVPRRRRADDVRLHASLARVFRSVGMDGRAAGERHAARRAMRRLARAVSDDPRQQRDAG